MTTPNGHEADVATLAFGGSLRCECGVRIERWDGRRRVIFQHGAHPEHVLVLDELAVAAIPGESLEPALREWAARIHAYEAGR